MDGVCVLYLKLFHCKCSSENTICIPEVGGNSGFPKVNLAKFRMDRKGGKHLGQRWFVFSKIPTRDINTKHEREGF